MFRETRIFGVQRGIKMDQGPNHLEVVMAEEKSTFVLRKKVTEVLRLLASPEANISSVRMYISLWI